MVIDESTNQQINNNDNDVLEMETKSTDDSTSSSSTTLGDEQLPILTTGRSRPLADIIAEGKEGSAIINEAISSRNYNIFDDINNEINKRNMINNAIDTTIKQENISVSTGTTDNATILDIQREAAKAVEASFTEEAQTKAQEELIQQDSTFDYNQAMPESDVFIPVNKNNTNDLVERAEAVKEQFTALIEKSKDDLNKLADIKESIKQVKEELSINTTEQKEEEDIVVMEDTDIVVNDIEDKDIGFNPTNILEKEDIKVVNEETILEEPDTEETLDDIAKAAADDVPNPADGTFKNIKHLFAEEKKEDVDDTTNIYEDSSLEEEDLTNLTDEESSEIVVPYSNAETVTIAAADADPRNYVDILNKQPEAQGFIELLAAISRNTKSYLHRLHKANEYFYTPQQSFNLKSLKNVESRIGSTDKIKGGVSLDGVVYRDKYANKSDFLESVPNNAVLKNNNAIRSITLLSQSIMQVSFYNSGFNVVLRAPLLAELSDYWRACTDKQNEYGRIFGQLCFIPADIYCRSAAMDLFEKLVIDSNLVDFSVPGVLRKALSFLDFETMLWAISCVMFPKGVKIDHICHEDKCRHTESVMIDVKSLRFNDYTLMSADNIKYTNSNEKRTVDDLIKYKASIKNDKEQVRIDDEWSTTIGIPSFFEYEESSLSFISEMERKIQLSALAEVNDYVNARYFALLAPFTKLVTYVSKENGKVINFEGIEGNISKLLESLQSGSISFSKTVHDFVISKKITHICYTLNACPSCGKIPASAVGRLVPCDVQNTFFTLVVKRINMLVSSVAEM